MKNKKTKKIMDKMMIAVETYDKIAQVYTKEFFDDKIDIKYLDKFLSFLPHKARVLDVGCGPGNFTKYFLGKGFYAEGIDLAPNMIKMAKKMVPEGIFKIMDMRKLKYPNKSFDGLCTAYSLCHISSNQALDVLKEFYRVLKPNAIMILMLQKGKGEVVIPEPLDPKRKMFFKYFQPGEIKNLLKKSGFKIIYQAERKSRGRLELKNKKLFLIAKKF